MTDTGKMLIENLDRLHSTEMGIARIKRNLNLDCVDVMEYCRNFILDKNCDIYQKGKNFYCEMDHRRLTVNSHSFTVITAHIF